MTLSSHHRLLPLPKRRLNPAPSVGATSRRWISDHDRLKLRDLLRDPHRHASTEWSLTRLRDLLQRARYRPASQLPGDTVRLGSSCAVHGEHLDETLRFVLTLPAKADPGRGRVSVLSPVGLAVLGRRQGQDCPALIPGGLGRFRILGVSNPPLHRASSPAPTHRASPPRVVLRGAPPRPARSAATSRSENRLLADVTG